MVDRQSLLKDLQKQVASLEKDLAERCKEVAEVDAKLKAEWQAARDAKRSAETYAAWREAFLTQVAVAWVLGTVFVRFLEDNRLIDEAWLSGPGDLLQRAKDQRTLFFQQNPTLSDREYLESVFRHMLELPAVSGLFDDKHNPLWSVGISGDGASNLLQFWQRVDPATGVIAHDFTDPEWDTRFLGDLYQDLSEAVRKRYALLQTPEFVEEFILDRTLTPAIDTFGFAEVRLIDPTCGSGHFLLGTFRRLFELWTKSEPESNPRELAQRALHQVAGVDVNPYAVAIARFRLLIAALQASGIERMKDAPAFELNVAAGDSLLHGPRFADTRGPTPDMFAPDSIHHVYQVEDRDELARILGRRYHAVVGNPPYITVKDKALNQAYRDRFGSCHRQYSMAVPFMERFWELAQPGGEGQPAGYVGMITANSFMKREFGKKLIEDYIPRWDMTHVVDTSGAYVPGHGTPTVILYGRNQRPVAAVIRTAMGIRGEPSTPEDPAKGLVWTAILDQIDQPGSESLYVSVGDTEREKFHSHPWSIGGGGAAELKDLLDERAEKTLGDLVGSIGFYQDTHADDAFVQPAEFVRRHNLEEGFRPQIRGDEVRDWCAAGDEEIFFPYDLELNQWKEIPWEPKWAWLHALKTVLWARSTFGGGTYQSDGRPWFDFHQFPKDRARTPLTIAFAFVATHNHFVLDRGGKVFNRSAPVIKLPPDATEDDHLALLGLLNSSLACFWMKQVFHCKGAQGINEGGKSEKWEQFFEFDGTKIKSFPCFADFPVALTVELENLSKALVDALARTFDGSIAPTAAGIHDLRRWTAQARSRLILLQEELDWLTLERAGLAPGLSAVTFPPGLDLGQRAFEIVMARNIRRGELATSWFERHGSVPIHEVPKEWPGDYIDAVETRIALIENDRNVSLVESPECKRRWSFESLDSQIESGLRAWLLDRLQAALAGHVGSLLSTAAMADACRTDPEFVRAANLYRGREDFDITALVTDLVESESVPFLAVVRYRASGLRKREDWGEIWALQRREDAGETFGEIPVPPKYTSADFASSTYWRLRGKLDVPKERFILYPHCERDADPTPVIGWAGWDHLQQARAVSAYYVQMKEQEGWTPQRLTPLLAGLLELEPWLLQWHNEVDPEYGVGMGDYFRDYVREEARGLGLTIEEIRDWQPPAKKARRRERKTG